MTYENTLILLSVGNSFALREASGFSFSRGGWMCSGISWNGVNGVLLEGARKRAPFDLLTDLVDKSALWFSTP
jgi:hypothetical protein